MNNTTNEAQDIEKDNEARNSIKKYWNQKTVKIN